MSFVTPLLLALSRGATAVPTAAPPSAPLGTVLFGIHTGQEGVGWAEIAHTWKEAERLGYDSAWVFDHLMPIRGAADESCLEAWTLLGALATQTEKLRIGVLVTGNTYRNPALLAKMATTVDHISRGRLNLGIGAAWFEPEHSAYGFEFGSKRDRARRLDESLQVITALWNKSHPSFAGRHYSLKDAPFSPSPLQKPHPPIIVGGQGKQWIMPLVARYADGWNAPMGITPDGIRERVAILRAECARIGRVPCDIEVSVFLPLEGMSPEGAGSVVSPEQARAAAKSKVKNVLAGRPQDIAGHIQNFIDAGVSHVIVAVRPPYDTELLRRFADEVIPAFRAPRSTPTATKPD